MQVCPRDLKRHVPRTSHTFQFRFAVRTLRTTQAHMHSRPSHAFPSPRTRSNPLRTPGRIKRVMTGIGESLRLLYLIHHFHVSSKEHNDDADGTAKFTIIPRWFRDIPLDPIRISHARSHVKGGSVVGYAFHLRRSKDIYDRRRIMGTNIEIVAEQV